MTRASHRRLTAATGVLVLSLLSCGREVTGPDEGAGFGRTATLALEPHLPGPMSVVAGAGDVVPFTRVRAILLRSDNSELFSQVVDFPAAADEVPLTLNVPLPVNTPASGLPLQLLLRYINAAGDTVFAGGPVAVTAIPLGTGSGQPQPVVIVLNWVGPGSNAAAVELSPPTGSAVAGTTTAFSVVVRDGQGQPMAGVPVVYSTADPTIAGIAAAGNGTVTWLPVRGTARVIASLPSGTFADTAFFTVALPPSQLTLVSGGAQTAQISTALGAPVTVRVAASDAVPVAGVTVTFAVASGGGTLGASTAVTDANGLASTTWTLGALVGAQSITATFAGLATPLTVTATASPPPATQLVIVSGIVPRAAGVLAADVVVQARDAFNNVATQFTGPVTGWVEVGPPGTNEDSVTVNAVAGVATFANVTFDQVGTYTLRFRAAGLTDATSAPFTVSAGPAASIVAFGGDLQTALPATLLPSPLTARLTDGFANPIAGATIDFSVQSGGGSLSVASAVTDAAGFASTQFTLGATVGIQVVRATLNGSPTIFRDFSATAIAGAAATINPGTRPTGLMAGQVGTFVVEVQDAQGNTATGFTGNVTIAIATAGGPLGGVIGGTTTRAAVAGLATFNDIFFNIRGLYNLVLASPGLPDAAINAFPVGPGPLSALTIVSGDAQAGSSGAPLAQPLVVRAVDAFGNGVSTTVTFAVATGLGSVTPAVVATDAAGLAQTSWTLGAPLGAQTVTATAPGVTAVTFTANAVPVTGGIRIWTGAANSVWSNPANWVGGIVPTSLDTVRIGDTNGAALDANVVISGLEVQSGGSLDIGDFILVVVGSLSAPTSPAITLGPNGGLGLQGPTGGTVSGALPTFSIGGGPYEASNVNVTGDVTVVSGRLILDDAGMTVSGLFATGGTGALEMLSGSTLTVGGDAAFLGGSTAGLLTGGQLFIGGDFMQGGGATDAFAASPGHETWFSSATPQSISFVNPGFGPGTSHFGTLYSGQPGTSQLDLQTDVYVNGALETGVTPTAKRFVGTDRLIVSLGADIDAAGIEFDGVRWELRDGGPIAALQNITFRNVPGNRTQWAIARAGGAHLMPQLRFLTPPTSGRYLELSDTDPGNGALLTLIVSAPTPATHGGAVLLLGGAVLNGWPELAGFTWTGAANSAWSNPANWLENAAPSPTDSVRIPATGIVNVPDVLTATTVRVLVNESVFPMYVTGTALTVTGALTLPVGTVGVECLPGGSIVLSGAAAKTAQGLTQCPLTINEGEVTLTDSLIVNGRLTISGTGRLTPGGRRVRVTNDLVTEGNGVLRMTNPQDTVRAFFGSFAGGDQTGQLTAGLLELGSGFGQLNSATSFVATGAHVTRFVGPAVPATVGFLNPATSQFARLEIARPLDFLTPARAATLALTAGGVLGGTGRLAVSGNIAGSPGTDVTIRALEFGGTYADSGRFRPDTTVFTGASQPLLFDSQFGTDPEYNSIRIAPGSGVVAAMPSGNTNAIVRTDLVIEGEFTMNEPSAPRNIDVVQDLRVIGNGLLRMVGNYSEMRVLRDAVFAGREMNGEMVTGALHVARNLVQLATTSPRSLRPASTFEFQFRSDGTTSFATPSESYLPRVSFFPNVSRTILTDVNSVGPLILNVNNIDLRSDVFGAGGTRTWAATGFSVPGVVSIRNVRVRVTGADAISVTGGLVLSQFDPAAIQLEFERLGGVATLSNTDFQTTPSGAGRYMIATDPNGATGGNFTVNVSAVTPPTHGGFAQAVNGAIINAWAAAALREYVGTPFGNWRDPANWVGGVAPGVADTAFIPSFVNGSPSIATGDTVRVGVLRHEGTNAILNQGRIVIRDSLFIGATSSMSCDGGGVIFLNPLDGTIGWSLTSPACTVTVLRGTARVAQASQVSQMTVAGDGVLDLNGQQLDVGGLFQTADRGRLRMMNSADRLVVAGTALFDGETTDGLITNGILRIGAFFLQGNSRSAQSFRASGSHIVEFVGTGASNITMQSAGATASTFATVIVQKGSTGTVNFGTDARIVSMTVGGGTVNLNAPAVVTLTGSLNYFLPAAIRLNAGATLSIAGACGGNSGVFLNLGGTNLGTVCLP